MPNQDFEEIDQAVSAAQKITKQFDSDMKDLKEEHERSVLQAIKQIEQKAVSRVRGFIDQLFS